MSRFPAGQTNPSIRTRRADKSAGEIVFNRCPKVPQRAEAEKKLARFDLSPCA